MLQVTFEGGRNVQPGQQIVIDLPQRTTDVAGLQGVTGKWEIDGTMGDQTIKHVADAVVTTDKVTITFNESVKDLPNGFTGTFKFSAKAVKQQSSEEVTTPVKIVVDGVEVTINVKPGENTGGSGNPLPPINPDEEMLTKNGVTGTEGKIRYTISGTAPGANSGNVVITDTPSGYKGKIDEKTFWLELVTNEIGEDGELQAVKQGYGIDKIRNELGGTLTFTDDGGFILTLPAEVVQDAKFNIIYNFVPEGTPNSNTVFKNKVELEYNNVHKEESAEVIYRQEGGGEIIGLQGSTLTLLKKDSTDGTLLPGATFQLTSTNGYSQEATSGEDGLLTFTGITDGEYTLMETNSPAGYQLSQDTYTFTVQDGQLVGGNLPSSFVIGNKKIQTSTSSQSNVSSSSSKYVISSSKASTSKTTAESSKASTSKTATSSKASTIGSTTSSKASTSKTTSAQSTSSKISTSKPATSSKASTSKPTTTSSKTKTSESETTGSTSNSQNDEKSNNIFVYILNFFRGNHHDNNGNGAGQGNMKKNGNLGANRNGNTNNEGAHKEQRTGSGLPQTGEIIQYGLIALGIIILIGTGVWYFMRRRRS